MVSYTWENDGILYKQVYKEKREIECNLIKLKLILSFLSFDEIILTMIKLNYTLYSQYV